MTEPLEVLSERLARAKRDMIAKERLIEDYLPFISATASEWVGRYIDRSIDDEYSIAMLAFNEAIDAFDPSKGESFISFARILIQRRLADYYRRRSPAISSLDDIAAMGTLYQPYVVDADMEDDAIHRLDIREEVMAYAMLLKQYDLTLQELVDVTPKRRKARASAMEIARYVAQDKELSSYLLRYKRLPITQLEALGKVSRKTLERHRKYIMAIALIWITKLESLMEYLKGE